MSVTSGGTGRRLSLRPPQRPVARPALSIRGTGGGDVAGGAEAGALRAGDATRGGGAPAGSAAASHISNDQYMSDFDTAYQQLYGDTPPFASFNSALALARFSSRREAAELGLSLTQAPAAVPDPLPLAAGWKTGPANAEGSVVDLSDRPIMCAALDPRSTAARAEFLVGGSDHAVYGVDLLRASKSRLLYGGRTGHTEWVTGVTFVGDGSGRAASCGMDARVCLWEAGGSVRAPPRCTVLEGHFGSVSTVACAGGGTPQGGPNSLRAGHVVVSAGYDKTLRLWDARRGGLALAELRGHAAPVIALALRAHDATSTFFAASGDRSGVVRVWDTGAGMPVAELNGHAGHITSLCWMEDLLLSGAQDGHVRVWDVRARAPVANIAAHATATGSGAVGDIAVSEAAASETAEAAPLVVTAGADKRMCVLDPRAGWDVRATLPGHRDFIYTLQCVRGLAISGAGDGLLIVHDVASGKPLWGVGANAAAVRCVAALADKSTRQVLAAAGDDGKAIVYNL